MSTYSATLCTEEVAFQWDDTDVHFVLDQHAKLDFNSVSSVERLRQENYSRANECKLKG
jgi:hypothetical protein